LEEDSLGPEWTAAGNIDYNPAAQQQQSFTVLPPNNHFTVSQIRTDRDGTITFAVKLPGPGTIDVLETAWDDNLAHAAVLLQPAAHRFVFARAHKTAHQATTLHLRVTPTRAAGCSCSTTPTRSRSGCGSHTPRPAASSAAPAFYGLHLLK
jgi:hypothetical protein